MQVLTILKLVGIVYMATDPLTNGPNKVDNGIETSTIVPPLCFGLFSLFASILLIVGVYKVEEYSMLYLYLILFYSQCIYHIFLVYYYLQKKKRFMLPWLILQCMYTFYCQ